MLVVILTVPPAAQAQAVVHIWLLWRSAYGQTMRFAPLPQTSGAAMTAVSYNQQADRALIKV